MGLCRPVVYTLLLLLGGAHELLHNRPDVFDLLLHLSHRFHHGAIGGGLFLPRLLRYIEEPLWPPPKQMFNRGESRGGLGCHSDCKEEVWEEQIPVTVLSVVNSVVTQ